MRKTLGELHIGDKGVVCAVQGGDKKLSQRLADMGVTPLTEISIRKVAPMGDPIEVRLRGYDLSLRKEDALSITLFEPKEAEEAIAKESERWESLQKNSAALLSAHAPDNDMEAHEGAARLTDWIVASSQDSLSFPIPGCRPGKRDCMDCGVCGSAGRAIEDVSSEADDKPIKLALAGNPNSGKTTLFNALTGSKEYVGNWPGVTVEKKEARFTAYNHIMTLVDLPGIYSLSPYSMEEVIARNFIIEEKPDAIINIVDGTNLERNLYLTLQLLELERPLILAINMMDEVQKSGDQIDVRKLSLELGVPVVPISARTREGVDELLRQCGLIVALVHEQLHRGFCVEPDHVYDSLTHAAHHEIGKIIGSAADEAGLPGHWAQTKLLEGDVLVHEQLPLTVEQKRRIENVITEYTGGDPLFTSAARVSDCRYRFITGLADRVVLRGQSGKDNSSEKIDDILTHKYFALPIFFAVMLGIFMLTFGSLGQWLSSQVEFLIGDIFASFVKTLLTDAPVWLTSLICDGVITGVGGVLTFLPQIAILFLCLSILEDSGYLSRTAFIMDKPLRRLGLSGKSFIPMLMGFGCTVPAAMGARAMDNEKDKRMTILLLPFMSCSAKLPIYGLVAGAFFAKYQGLIVFSLYALGIVMGIITGLLFKNTLFKAQDAPFVMEMPPFRRPSVRNTLQRVNERLIHFLEKAGTIILLMSVVLWFLESFDPSFRMVGDVSESILARFGSAIAPAFEPLGFGTWQAVVALLTGFVAKEAVVSSLSLFYGFTTLMGDTAVRAALSSTFTPLSAYAFLVFVLLYVPCMAAVTTMRKELNSAKWTAFMIAYQILFAYAASMLIYQIGSLIGL